MAATPSLRTSGARGVAVRSAGSRRTSTSVTRLSFNSKRPGLLRKHVTVDYIIGVIAYPRADAELSARRYLFGDNGHLAARILVGAAGCRISRRGLGNHVRALGIYVVKKLAINSARARAHSKARWH